MPHSVAAAHSHAATNGRRPRPCAPSAAQVGQPALQARPPFPLAAPWQPMWLHERSLPRRISPGPSAVDGRVPSQDDANAITAIAANCTTTSLPMTCRLARPLVPRWQWPHAARRKEKSPPLSR
ncbi:hypothetical protein FH972_024377 [Carpinus fangiana]|uniref:Uncharacterized protein n=1 Tax=Carpinus fangiana TaxID=176857 RepID=A0A5N6KXV4_9ROSI|nr:hypothetical protein FH972_024377 [Carpinus fangiana]